MTTLVYRTRTAASMATKPSRPTTVRRRTVVSVASIAHNSAPVPAAISEASVKVGIVARHAKASAAPELQNRTTAHVPPQRPSQRRAPKNRPRAPSAP
jgi:hypothetical protein